MNAEIQKQMEHYSNGIVTFIVVQSLTFSYAFGTSQFFNNLIKSVENLSRDVLFLLIAVLFLSVMLNGIIGWVLWRSATDHSRFIGLQFVGKTVVLLLFGSLPPALVHYYG